MKWIWLGVMFTALSTGVPQRAEATPAPTALLDELRPTVMVFVGRTCPISNRYAPALERMYQRYKDRVSFQLVYPNGRDTPAEIQAHVDAFGLSWTPHPDPLHVRVALAGASITPEAAVFDAAGKRRYLGRIDDRWVTFGRMRAAPTVRDLEEAIEAVLAGRAPQAPRTKAVGCYISPEMKRTP